MTRGRVLVKAIWGAATNRVSLFFSAATAVGALLFQSGALCGVAVAGTCSRWPSTSGGRPAGERRSGR